METKKKGFPAAFWVCACTEIFERLAYYLGRSLILIFVTASVATGGLGLSDTVAANMQSNLTAFSYLLPLFGAVIVDKYIGARYTTPVGMFIAAAGYFTGGIAKSSAGVYAMIFLVSLGLALFKKRCDHRTCYHGQITDGSGIFDALYTGKCGCIHRNIPGGNPV